MLKQMLLLFTAGFGSRAKAPLSHSIALFRKIKCFPHLIWWMLKQDKHAVKVGNCNPNIVVADNSCRARDTLHGSLCICVWSACVCQLSKCLLKCWIVSSVTEISLITRAMRSTPCIPEESCTRNTTAEQSAIMQIIQAALPGSV